ncbi:Hsp33 family molecular chaperone HslO [Luteimonas sp. MC1825]|uniref:Hsp33 family molecular chaperone HslO n=1 Tax=Luteimonas sp. MC1825 TaxID=2761107 RepID=UPI00162032F7|nr:Hsp33 family molecular chaperone HslO [Luteimonas sp. MC1825]QOC88705.1 Hsp33 family molecular chaperone HslO [Luteimonas sp. MC1825]
MTHPDRDHLTRFLLPRAGVRGVHVHLDDTWRSITSSDDYPPTVRAMLGESSAAAALFTGHTKVDGRLSVQLRGTSALRTLFAECTAAGTLRGIARMADDAGDIAGLHAIGDDALLAITIENPGIGDRDPVRYQSLVSLDAPDLSTAFEAYFVQSEQLPTRILLAADGDSAVGLMLQKLPGDSVADVDGWDRASALFSTLRCTELLETGVGELLHRLFHEEDPQIVGGRPLEFACSCSRGRVEAMLASLGRTEAEAALADGVASVRCEFCGQAYAFDAAGIHAIFTQQRSPMDAPPRLQ